MVNLFVPNAPFLYPLQFSNVFRGQRKVTLGTNGLNTSWNQFIKEKVKERKVNKNQSTYRKKLEWQEKVLFHLGSSIQYARTYISRSGGKKCQVFAKFCVRNPFQPSVPFLYPLKMSENQRVFDVFRGVQKRNIDFKYFKFFFCNRCYESWNYCRCTKGNSRICW